MFTVRQKVWDVVRGEGKVVEVRNYDCNYPVVVEFASGERETYTKEGMEYKSHEKPSLYPSPAVLMITAAKPSIDWEHVRKDFKFLAQDADGNVYLYWEKPELGACGWKATRGEFVEAQSHASYNPGYCDWKDSLVERP